MKYFSTRDLSRQFPVTLKDAAFMGLAPDGGLFMPEYIPRADLDTVRHLAERSYSDLAFYLASLFFSGDVPSEKLERMIRRAYDFDCPLVNLEPGLSVLELFHGPTFAFKDFGARFMGGMLGLLYDGESSLIVLTATSGDTGSAVAAGFHNVPGIKVVVLYPEGKVSPIQEAQMTTLGGNIHPVCVRGNFDDCQALVKSVFNDVEFRSGINVTSANSINVLRWIPQSFYYFYAWAHYSASTGENTPDIVVPSGNFGNITAGMLAWKMGLPVRRFVAACNANDVIPEYLSTGKYRPRPSVRTVANAMDVGAPSNFERLMYLFDNDFDSLKADLAGYSYSDNQIKTAIAEIYARHSYLSDPHSAAGWLAAKESGSRGFYLSTAHPAKFAGVIEDAFRKNPVLAGGLSANDVVKFPDALLEASKREKSFVTMDNDLGELEQFIYKF